MKNFPIKKCLTTNGFLLEKTAQLLKSLGICKINVSVHNESFKNPEFVKALTFATEQNLIVSLNSVVNFENVNKMQEILKFCKTLNLSVKFFLILELKKEEHKLLFAMALNNIKSSIPTQGKFNLANKRIGFSFGNRTVISLNTVATNRDRPYMCKKCKVFNLCQESCWDSIRITNKYIKPCGIREDNVFFFDSTSLEVLREKLHLERKH
ncbi:MAG: hypothetical protein ACP5P3_01335 [Ignavibacteria bacterium]